MGTRRLLQFGMTSCGRVIGLSSIIQASRRQLLIPAHQLNLGTSIEFAFEPRRRQKRTTSVDSGIRTATVSIYYLPSNASSLSLRRSPTRSSSSCVGSDKSPRSVSPLSLSHRCRTFHPTMVTTSTSWSSITTNSLSISLQFVQTPFDRSIRAQAEDLRYTTHSAYRILFVV